MNRKELIIFDLDGTLLDTSQGIYNSVRYAEQEMGFEPISDDRLREFVGPPPKKMYMTVYGVSEEIAMKAAQKHREYGRSKAIYEAVPYPDMKSTLVELKQKGYKLAVATLKSEEIAISVLTITGLLECFDTVVGMDAKESLTKADTIRIAMDRTDVLDVQKTTLVGDSEYDWIGAKECGVDFIAAMYGFGTEIFKCLDVKKIHEIKELLLYW